MSLHNFDDFKLAVESISGGSNTVIFDDMEMPSVMVRIPKMTNMELMEGGTDQCHFAFIVDNEEKDAVYVSKYLNIIFRDRAYSLPNQLPRSLIDFDRSLEVCRNKGNGFHLTTNAMYAVLALLARRRGLEPRGNTNWGRDHEFPHERGHIGDVEAETGRTTRTLTGSGPASWYDDFTKHGIADLCGNLLEWASGLRLVEGEIQIIPYGNAMKLNASHALNSTLWRAIDQSGNLIAPGSVQSLKIDSTVPGNANEISETLDGGIVISTSRDFPQFTGSNPDRNGHWAHSTVFFRDVAARAGTTVPNILRLLGIFPVSDDIERGRMWLINYGERLPLRGGDWFHGSGAGVFALSMSLARGHTNLNVGFRSAFVNL